MKKQRNKPQNKQEQVDIRFSVKQVNLVEFDIVSKEFNTTTPEGFRYKLIFKVKQDSANDSVSVKVLYDFYRHDEQLFFIEVDNVFGVKNIAGLGDAGVFRFKEFLVVLFSISISQMRAIHSHVAKDTSAALYLLPVLNPPDIKKHVEALLESIKEDSKE